MPSNPIQKIVLLSDHTETVAMQKILGPYKVAHELRQHGFDVTVIDHVHIFTKEELFILLDKIVDRDTVMIGINNFFFKDISKPHQQASGALYWPFAQPGQMLPHGKHLNRDLRELIKNKNPDCKLVLGGPAAADVSSNRDFDFVVLGYGDLSMPNLAKFLAGKDTLKKSYKSIHGFTVVDDSRAQGFDIGSSTMRFSAQDRILPGETIPIEISRGCIFNCAFCSFPLNGKNKNDYIRSEEILYREFEENFEKFGVTRYIFSDDTFNDNVEKISMLSRISKKLSFPLEYWAFLRLDLMQAHRHTVDMMVESGLRACFFGIETFNHSTGKIIGKGAPRDKLIQTLEYLKTNSPDIMLHANFIVGLPKESEKSCRDTFQIVSQKDFPLDSWSFEAFFLDDVKDRTNGFISQITQDPAKYGYRIKDKKNHILIWENEHMDYHQAQDMVDEFMNTDMSRRCLPGLYSFYLSSLGLSLDFSKNKPIELIDWTTVVGQKILRANQYRKQTFNVAGLDCEDNNLEHLFNVDGQPLDEAKIGYWWVD